MIICNHKISPQSPPFIIAEMSGNHNQSLDVALAIVDAAADAGAHAIKLQTYTADTMTLDIRKGDFFISNENSPWKGSCLYDLYNLAHTPWEWHEPIMKRAKKRGLVCFSTPFDKTSVDFLEDLEVPAYKIASFEMIDHDLIDYVARKGKPIILSTGMATEAEIKETLEIIKRAGNSDIALLKCTSAYPAPPNEMNLRTIPDMIRKFKVPVGISDHTMGYIIPVIAVTLGASIVEKHFTISRSDPGPDCAFSLEPKEFKEMVDSINIAGQALGSVRYAPESHEKHSLVFRRSLYVVADIKEGEIFNETNIRSIRPGYGLPPKELKNIYGRKAMRDIRRGMPLSWDLIG